MRHSRKSRQQQESRRLLCERLSRVLASRESYARFVRAISRGTQPMPKPKLPKWLVWRCLRKARGQKAPADLPKTPKMLLICPGDKFGMLTAVEPLESAKNGMLRWKFRCDCGTEFQRRSADIQRYLRLIGWASCKECYVKTGGWEALKAQCVEPVAPILVPDRTPAPIPTTAPTTTTPEVKAVAPRKPRFIAKYQGDEEMRANILAIQVFIAERRKFIKVTTIDDICWHMKIDRREVLRLTEMLLRGRLLERKTCAQSAGFVLGVKAKSLTTEKQANSAT